jgi:CRISPR/Cas system-associated exonuclease Cas4 (RecB family)
MSDIDFSKIYSYSKLNLFDRCKRQFYFNYLDPLVAPIKKQFIKPRDYKTRGQAVHGAITLFLHMPEQMRNFENLKKCLQQAWYADADPSIVPPLGIPGGFKDIEHERKVYMDSLKLLRNFIPMEKKMFASVFYLPTKEIKYSFCDYKEMIQPIDEEIAISGKFDLVGKTAGGNLAVVDFKTSKGEQDSFQLEFYKLLAELNFGLRVDEVSYCYLGNRNIKRMDVSKIDSNEIKDRIIEKITTINNCKDFPPKRSYLCNHCDFKEICPAFVSTTVETTAGKAC